MACCASQRGCVGSGGAPSLGRNALDRSYIQHDLRRVLVRMWRPRRRSRIVCSAVASPRSRPADAEEHTPPKPVNPFAEKIEYVDGTFDRLLIRFLTLKISQEVGIKPQKEGYDGFVEMSEAIMQGRSPEQQRETVLTVLNSVLPAIIPWAARTYFRPSELTCFLCAFFAHIGFEWLVGEMELQEKEVELPDGSTRTQLSTVHIKKCRYLEQSGCVGMCVNMCKVPTQTFFTRDFGMPLYMEPNFEDLSCKMIFGTMPPDIKDDPVSTQPCFSSCSIGMVNDSKCKKLPAERKETVEVSSEPGSTPDLA